MAELLGDKTRSGRERESLRKEGTPVADDLLGRLNAMDFIDSVLGEDYELPSRIGDFEITGVLGRGGMGTVYKAYQENLDREIALKVLAPRFSTDPTMRQRFRTEAKATAAMHHQHIVPIYGYGEASGHLFFAMELVTGVSLDKHITVARRKGEGALEPEDAARRFAGVADALALAHKRQILHRDVKPGNILIHDDGTLALADFGLSKFLGEVSAQLTSIGGFLGTLHYAPPEQARGEDLGPASDLYSLGVTIFETVTGKLPVYGQSTESMLHALLHDEPIRLRQILPKAPRDLEAVISKLLQKDPRDRYQDGETLALDLIRIAEGEPVRIRRQGLVVRVYRRLKRKPVVAGIIGVLFVLLIVTGLWFREVLVGDELERQRNGREHLRLASMAVASESGSSVGPHRVLDVLSGGETTETTNTSQFLREIEAAAKLLPDETANIARYRDAYAGHVFGSQGSVDPVGLLRLGNGFGAVDALTEKIRSIKANFKADDLGERIDLYNLYVARAIASISASVADPQQARNDLNLASFIRSGAKLPHMLQAFLAWKERTQPKLLIDSLKEFTSPDDPQHLDPELRRATGEFLLSFAGVSAPPGSHLMRFSMGYAVRKILSDKADEFLGLKDAKREEWYHGLEHQLAQHATKIVNNLGIMLEMQAPLKAGRDLLRDSVAPSSPIKSWSYAFDLLEDVHSRSQPLSEENRLRGAIHYLRVVQRVQSFDDAIVLLTNLEGIVGPLLALVDSPERGLRELAVELRARLHSWTANRQVALTAVDAWLKVNDRDPAAQACKFCSLVRSAPRSQEEFFRVLLFGRNAILYAADAVRLGVRDRLVKRVSHELAQVQDGVAQGFLRQLLQSLGGE